MGRGADSVPTEPLKKIAVTSSTAPRITTAPPVRAPNCTWPAMPPAPWHMGTPPTLALSRFIRPVEVAILPSLTGRLGKSRLFSSVMAITALPSVKRHLWQRQKDRTDGDVVPGQLSAARTPAAAARPAGRAGHRRGWDRSASRSRRRTAAAGTWPVRRDWSAAARSPSRAPPPTHQFCDIIFAPSIMKPKPSPRMMPMTMGRLTRLATRLAVPVRPSTSHTRPVTRLAPCTMAGREDERLCRLGRSDGAGRLHRLHRNGRAIDEAAHHHGNAEGEQHAERVHLEHGEIGDDEGDERAEVAERARDFHAVEAVRGRLRSDGFRCHRAPVIAQRRPL